MKRKERKALEEALRQQHELEMRKKNIIDYFLFYSRYHIEWMKDLVSAYKRRGEFPLMPSLLADYYTNSRDIETALLMTISIRWNSANVYRQVQDMKRIIGNSPYLWLRNGDYKILGLPRNQYDSIDGYSCCRLWKVSRIADRLSELCKGSEGFSAFEEVFNGSESLPKFAENLCVEYELGEKRYRGRVLDIVFRTSDGIGKGLWSLPDDYHLRCPYTRDIELFLKMCFPSYHVRLFSFDDAVSLFGFERDSDFFYAYLGWKDLCRRNPEKCNLYAKKYSSWYRVGANNSPWVWRTSLPEIE